MAVRITARCDLSALQKDLMRNAQRWVKEFEWAARDMRRSGNTIISRHTASVYNINRQKVNANNKKFKGGCTVTGGIAEMTWNYEGHMQTPVDFGMSPTARQKGRYTTTASILKGSVKKVGHGGPPWSEGGRHRRGMESPAFFIPGIKPPLYRDSAGKFTAVKVIAVPQMVESDRHIGDTLDDLQRKHMEIVERRLSALGLT